MLSRFVASKYIGAEVKIDMGVRLKGDFVRWKLKVRKGGKVLGFFHEGRVEGDLQYPPSTPTSSLPANTKIHVINYICLPNPSPILSPWVGNSPPTPPGSPLVL